MLYTEFQQLQELNSIGNIIITSCLFAYFFFFSLLDNNFM